METVIVIIIAIIAIFIYKMVTEPSSKEILAKSKSEEKANEEIVEFKKKEIIFNQFRGYIDNLFADNLNFSKDDLFKKLAKDFSYYKNGDTSELFYDLREARLIERDYKTELYTKGKAFEDLRLTFPDLIEFLKKKWNMTDGFTHDMHGRNRIEKGSISKIIDSSIYITYFHFGVSKGNDLLKELKIADNYIAAQSLYLYSKTERHIKNLPGNPIEKKLLHYDYKYLEKELSSSQCEHILNEWLAKASAVVRIQ